MNPRWKRQFEYHRYLDDKYESELQDLQNKLVNHFSYGFSNENYCYILSLIINLKNNKTSWKINHFRRYLAAYRIQLHWRKTYLNPHHPIGKQHLSKEYDKLLLLVKSQDNLYF